MSENRQTTTSNTQKDIQNPTIITITKKKTYLQDGKRNSSFRSKGYFSWNKTGDTVRIGYSLCNNGKNSTDRFEESVGKPLAAGRAVDSGRNPIVIDLEKIRAGKKAPTIQEMQEAGVPHTIIALLGALTGASQRQYNSMDPENFKKAQESFKRVIKNANRIVIWNDKARRSKSNSAVVAIS